MWPGGEEEVKDNVGVVNGFVDRCNRCWERGIGVVVRRDGVVVNCSSVTASFTKGMV